MKLDHLPTLHTRINSKWIKDLNVRPQTIKITEEDIFTNILVITHSHILSDISPQARKTKEKIKPMGLYQTKKFWCYEENHQQTKKTTHIVGEHIC